MFSFGIMVRLYSTDVLLSLLIFFMKDDIRDGKRNGLPRP